MRLIDPNQVEYAMFAPPPMGVTVGRGVLVGAAVGGTVAAGTTVTVGGGTVLVGSGEVEAQALAQLVINSMVTRIAIQ
jgi:hypothetical protein